MEVIVTHKLLKIRKAPYEIQNFIEINILMIILDAI